MGKQKPTSEKPGEGRCRDAYNPASVNGLGVVGDGGFCLLSGATAKARIFPVVIAGLALPLLIMIAAYYGVATDDPDGPPPGMVLMGALVIAAITTPVTLIVSGLAVRFARR